MDERLDLHGCWDWFSRVESTLGFRSRMVSAARRALLRADDVEKADLTTGIELLIAEIDRDALTADRIGAALVEGDAVHALESVSRKLDRLSVKLTRLIVSEARVASQRE